MIFENMILGPVVAIDSSKSVSQHIKDILNRGYIPIAVVSDRKNDVFKPFENNKDFKNFNTVAVVITVRYIQAYE